MYWAVRLVVAAKPGRSLVCDMRDQTVCFPITQLTPGFLWWTCQCNFACVHPGINHDRLAEYLYPDEGC